MLETITEIVPVKLDNNSKIFIQILRKSGDEDVAFSELAFSNIMKSVPDIAGALYKAVDAISPQKVSIEFGLSMGIESGQLTTILVQGTGSANVVIKMEWTKE